ncbi:MAG: group II intron reverse transcriptase/maturase [Hyphomicrobium sp.]
MTLSTPDTIRTLQRSLYLKAKQEPKFRFYALYDKVCRVDILTHAYALVRANKGAPGVDGVTFAAIEAGCGAAAVVDELRQQLIGKTYRASPVRRVWIPKANGDQRPLGIPTIRDRVVQMALKLVIEPIFEADFCETSYGFRPKRSAHDAIDAIANALVTGHVHVIDADLSKYFDTIPHAKLMAVVAERIADGAVLALIKQWLVAPVVEEDGDGTRRMSGGKGNREGTPQGGVISPLLANIYLHLLDRLWQRRDLAQQLNARLVRYADDFVVLCRRDTERPMAVVRHVLGRLGLTLNETKTRTVDARIEGFDFLGFSIEQRVSHRSGKRYPHIEPSKRSRQRIKDKIKALTTRQRTPIPLEVIVAEVNATLRGWLAYFHKRNCQAALKDMRWFTEERLRTHLRDRHHVRCRATGYRRFPSRKLYAVHGLHKVPTTAGWQPRMP